MKPNQYNSNHEELRHIAPRLAAIPKLGIEESFVLPAGYFEKMQVAVLNHPFVKVTHDFVVPDLYFEALPETIAQNALVAKQSPFVVPTNYFEQLALQVEQKLDIAPMQNNLEVPEGYFENLPLKIQDRLYKEKKEAKVFWLPQVPQYRLALVAAVVAILVVMLFYVRLFENSTSTKPQLALKKMSESTITAATEDLNEYDESMLIEAIDQPTQIEIAGNNEQQQVRAEITEYLIENDITIDDITEAI
jgi:hypothetical protein